MFKRIQEMFTGEEIPQNKAKKILGLMADIETVHVMRQDRIRDVTENYETYANSVYEENMLRQDLIKKIQYIKTVIELEASASNRDRDSKAADKLNEVYREFDAMLRIVSIMTPKEGRE